MPGPNITGTANTNDYNLGRGKLYLGNLDPVTGKPLEWRDVGNCNAFNVSIESETLEHRSSRSGLAVTDKKVETSRTTNLSITLDELNHENLALFFSGTQSTDSNPAVAGFAEFTLIAAGSPGVRLGRWYDLTNAAGVRVYDLDPARVTLKDNSDNVLVSGVDFDLDLVNGRVFFRHNATALAAGEGVKFTLAADAGAKSVNKVNFLTTTNPSYAVKFIAENPANASAQSEIQFHKVALNASGDLGMISDDWTSMTLEGVAESNSFFGNSPYGHHAVVAP